MHRSRLAFAAVVLVAAACSRAPHTQRVLPNGTTAETSLPRDQDAAAPDAFDWNGTIRNGARLSGSYDVATLHLPPSHIAYVTDDVTIQVRGDATIEGTLVAIREEERHDAPDIRIFAGGFLCVTGVVHGAPGRDVSAEEVGARGGEGSTLWLEGATLWNGGHLIAGRGGRGGSGAAGGTGGSVLWVGETVPAGVEIPAARAAGIGASGGEGGPGTDLGGGAFMGGGDGGKSGVVGQFLTPEEAITAVREAMR